MARHTMLVNARLFVAAVVPTLNRSATGRTGIWGSNTRWGIRAGNRRPLSENYSSSVISRPMSIHSSSVIRARSLRTDGASFPAR